MQRRRGSRHCILGSVPLRVASPIPWQSVTTIFLMVFFALGTSLCPADWTEISGRCYRYLPDKVSWEEAKVACEDEGSNLTAVRSINQSEQLTQELNILSRTWLVGNDILAEGDWLWTDGSNIDGEGLWYPGEPENGTTGQDCLYFNMTSDTGTWLDMRCDVYSPFVCEKEVPCVGDSPKTLSTYNGTCYTLWKGKYVEKLEKANLTCKDKSGGQLVKIESKDENSWLFDWVKTILSGNFVLLGGNDLRQEGEWVWSDATSMDFTFWRENEPNNFEQEHNCLSNYDGNDLRFTDDACKEKKYPLCERETIPPPVDGSWSEWTKLTHYTLPCRQGSRSRERSSNNPTPQHGGQDCSGNKNETEYCNIGECTYVFINGAGYMKVEGKVLLDHVLTRTRARSVLECLTRCAALWDCVSVSYLRDHAMCEVNEMSVNGNVTALTDMTEAVYLEFDVLGVL